MRWVLNPIASSNLKQQRIQFRQVRHKHHKLKMYKNVRKDSVGFPISQYISSLCFLSRAWEPPSLRCLRYICTGKPCEFDVMTRRSEHKLESRTLCMFHVCRCFLMQENGRIWYDILWYMIWYKVWYMIYIYIVTCMFYIIVHYFATSRHCLQSA